MRLLLYIVSACFVLTNTGLAENTFVFDFDDTIRNGRSTSVDIMAYIARNNTDKQDEILKIRTDASKEKFPSITAKMITLWKRTGIIPQKSDFDFIIKDTISNKINNGIEDAISYLISKKQKVIVLGGGAFGCAFIPGVAKKLGIPKENVYSGRFFSHNKQDMEKSLELNSVYSNCQDNTFYGYKKSDAISTMRQKGKISGKVIMIGDHDIDLEAYQAKQADIFIGFGISNKLDSVKNNSTYFVENADEFKNAIQNILENKEND